MKSTISWDITPCSPLSVNRRFGGTNRLHLEGQKITSARNQRASRWQVLARWFLAQLIFWPWRWKRYVPPKFRLILNWLHGVISQKVVFLKPSQCYVTFGFRFTWHLLHTPKITSCWRTSILNLFWVRFMGLWRSRGGGCLRTGKVLELKRE
jgi:hypothetical protein